MIVHTETTWAFRSVDRPRDQVGIMSTLCFLLLRGFGGTSAGTHASPLRRRHAIRLGATSHAITSGRFEKAPRPTSCRWRSDVIVAYFTLTGAFFTFR
jgi:hypothetical protein